MTTETEHAEWEFYPARVDDAPASIFLNLALRRERPSNLGTLYYVGLQILQPDEHGMGTAEEAQALYQIEDVLIAEAESTGLLFVGRLRNHGDWQLSFYGPPELSDKLEGIVGTALSQSEQKRGYRLGNQQDDAWSYYNEFLYPDEERLQWIMNRRVVDNLENSGDNHDVSRQVDHFAFFGTRAAHDAFVEDAKALGFSAEPCSEAEGVLRFGAQLHRNDSVQLGHIHQVVIELRDLAVKHGGSYDGWGTTVER